jgi:hypothetical protein
VLLIWLLLLLRRPILLVAAQSLVYLLLLLLLLAYAVYLSAFPLQCSAGYLWHWFEDSTAQHSTAQHSIKMGGVTLWNSRPPCISPQMCPCSMSPPCSVRLFPAALVPHKHISKQRKTR